VLFNGGANINTDYYSFLQGIQDVINHKPADTSSIPVWLYRLGIIAITIMITFLAVRRILRNKCWYQNYRNRPKWRSWSYILMRLLPVVLLLLIPTLITVLSGRVLSWQRIILMFADVVLVLGLSAALNTLVVIGRLMFLSRQN
jgi:hypothetical protein